MSSASWPPSPLRLPETLGELEQMVAAQDAWGPIEGRGEIEASAPYSRLMRGFRAGGRQHPPCPEDADAFRKGDDGTVCFWWLRRRHGTALSCVMRRCAVSGEWIVVLSREIDRVRVARAHRAEEAMSLALDALAFLRGTPRPASATQGPGAVASFPALRSPESAARAMERALRSLWQRNPRQAAVIVHEVEHGPARAEDLAAQLGVRPALLPVVRHRAHASLGRLLREHLRAGEGTSPEREAALEACQTQREVCVQSPRDSCLPTSGLELCAGDTIEVAGEGCPRTVTSVSGRPPHAVARFRGQGALPTGRVCWRVRSCVPHARPEPWTEPWAWEGIGRIRRPPPDEPNLERLYEQVVEALRSERAPGAWTKALEAWRETASWKHAPADVRTPSPGALGETAWIEWLRQPTSTPGTSEDAPGPGPQELGCLPTCLRTGTVLLAGFDSAWTSAGEGALTLLHVGPDRAEVAVPPTRVTFAQAWTHIAAAAEARPGVGQVVVAIDQPVVVPNEQGRRGVDAVASRLALQVGSAVQPANRKRIGMFDDAAPIWGFLRQARSRWPDLSLDPADIRKGGPSAVVLEVTPVLALLGLFPGLARQRQVFRYNPTRPAFRRGDWHALGASLALAFHRLDVPGLADASARLAQLHAPGKRAHDLLESLLCTLVGLIAVRGAPFAVVGDPATGRLLIPASEPLLSMARPEADAARVAVDLLA